MKLCNKENMFKLVEALESGEYTQCQTALHRPSGFCCLGVATDLALKELGGSWDKLVSNGTDQYYYYTDPRGRIRASGFLTEFVQDWLGIQTTDPIIDTVTGAVPASTLNDKGVPFKTIAAAFRRTYLEE